MTKEMKELAGDERIEWNNWRKERLEKKKARIWKKENNKKLAKTWWERMEERWEKEKKKLTREWVERRMEGRKEKERKSDIKRMTSTSVVCTMLTHTLISHVKRQQRPAEKQMTPTWIQECVQWPCVLLRYSLTTARYPNKNITLIQLLQNNIRQSRVYSVQPIALHSVGLCLEFKCNVTILQETTKTIHCYHELQKSPNLHIRHMLIKLISRKRIHLFLDITRCIRPEYAIFQI